MTAIHPPPSPRPEHGGNALAPRRRTPVSQPTRRARAPKLKAATLISCGRNFKHMSKVLTRNTVVIRTAHGSMRHGYTEGPQQEIRSPPRVHPSHCCRGLAPLIMANTRDLSLGTERWWMRNWAVAAPNTPRRDSIDRYRVGGAVGLVAHGSYGSKGSWRPPYMW